MQVKLSEDVGFMFKYLSIIVVCLTEEQKVNVIILIMSTKKVRENNTTSPHKCQPRHMHSEINKYIHNYFIGNTH